jgi:hypothetical protein
VGAGQVQNRECVPKRQHINFRRRGITEKKTYKIIMKCLDVASVCSRVTNLAIL